MGHEVNSFIGQGNFIIYKTMGYTLELFYRLKKMKKWKETIEVKNGLVDLVHLYAQKWDIWGSCQYQTAAGFFYLIRNMRKDEVSWEDCLSLLGISECSFTKIISDFAGFTLKLMYQPMYQNILKEDQPPKDPTNADEAFALLRDSSWDLWGAAPEIASWCFQNLKVAVGPKSPGVGPALNQIIQGSNYEVGLCCALLYEHGVVKDISSFKGFNSVFRIKCLCFIFMS